jgi:hypothetical protein
VKDGVQAREIGREFKFVGEGAALLEDGIRP